MKKITVMFAVLAAFAAAPMFAQVSSEPTEEKSIIEVCPLQPQQPEVVVGTGSFLADYMSKGGLIIIKDMETGVLVPVAVSPHEEEALSQCVGKQILVSYYKTPYDPAARMSSFVRSDDGETKSKL